MNHISIQMTLIDRFHRFYILAWISPWVVSVASCRPSVRLFVLRWPRTNTLEYVVKSLGYSNANAQLYTVPPYAVALVFMTLVSAISDRMRSRGIFVALVFTISSIGWIILLAVVDNNHARYFATFCIVIGGYAAIPLWVWPSSFDLLLISSTGSWLGCPIILHLNLNERLASACSILLVNAFRSLQRSSSRPVRDLDGIRDLGSTLPSTWWPSLLPLVWRFTTAGRTRGGIGWKVESHLLVWSRISRINMILAPVRTYHQGLRFTHFYGRLPIYTMSEGNDEQNRLW